MDPTSEVEGQPGQPGATAGKNGEPEVMNNEPVPGISNAQLQPAPLQPALPQPTDLSPQGPGFANYPPPNAQPLQPGSPRGPGFANYPPLQQYGAENSNYMNFPGNMGSSAQYNMQHPPPENQYRFFDNEQYHQSQGKNSNSNSNSYKNTPGNYEQSSEDLIHETYFIPPSFHGKIIGKRGCNAQKYKNMGVTVKVPVQSSDSSVVTLMSYNQDAVNETVRLMADLIGFYPLKEDLCEVTFQLAGQHIGKLIGSGGSTMHDIQRCCCCGIETPARGNQNNEPVRIQVPQSKVKKLMDRLQYELGFLPEYSERSLAEYSVGGKFDSKENEKETQQEQNTSRKRKRSSDEKKDLKQNKKIKLQKPIVIDDTEWKKEFDNSSTLINQFQTTQQTNSDVV